MLQQSEVISLLMAAALAPVMYVSVGRISFAGKGALIVGALCMLASYVFTVVETYVLADAFNLLEHLALAASGVAFGLGVFQLARDGRRRVAGDAS